MEITESGDVRRGGIGWNPTQKCHAKQLSLRSLDSGEPG